MNPLKLLRKIFPFKRIEIPDGEGNLYLVRFVLIELFSFRLYLHHFLANDGSRDCHDHPNSFIIVRLWGGYVEHVLQKGETVAINDGDFRQREITYKKHAPGITFRKATHAHRIDVPKRAWTLVLMFPRKREWGFYTQYGWMHWREYLTLNPAADHTTKKDNA